MRILRINCLSEPAGGVERYIYEADRFLVNLGHKVITVEINSTKKPGNVDLTEHLYVNDHPLYRFFRDITTDVSVLSHLMSVHEKFKPDIIHLHHFRVSFMAVAKFINAVSTPCIYTSHDAQLVCPIATLVLPDGTICEGGIKTRCIFTGCQTGPGVPYEIYRVHVFNKLVKGRISAYVCPSNAIKNYMEKFGYTPAIVIGSLTNIDINSTEKLDLPKGNTIGFLGRIDRHKGLQYLIDAVSLVKNDIPDIHLEIAGEGDFLDVVKNRVNKLNLQQNVSFLGQLPREAHREFFSSIKFLVIPSIMIENRIFTAQESFAYGRTVVASDVGGIPEIVQNGINGVLVKPTNVEELASKIEMLLSDETLLIKYSDNAFKSIVEMIKNESGMERIVDIYEKVIKSAPGKLM